MSETRKFDGPDWRDNPDENGAPVRRRGGACAPTAAKIAAAAFEGSPAWVPCVLAMKVRIAPVVSE